MSHARTFLGPGTLLCAATLAHCPPGTFDYGPPLNQVPEQIVLDH